MPPVKQKQITSFFAPSASVCDKSASIDDIQPIVPNNEIDKDSITENECETPRKQDRLESDEPHHNEKNGNENKTRNYNRNWEKAFKWLYED